MSQPDPQERMRAISRRSFIWAGAAVLGGYGVIRYLNTRTPDGGTPWPLRRGYEWNESLWKDAFNPKAVRTFDKSQVTEARQNGDEGLSDDFDPEKWQLSVVNVAGKDGPVTLTLADIKKLPQVEQTTELCCIEGWSFIVTWTGVRLADFIKKYPPATTTGDAPDVEKHPENLVRYVGMETPDGGYYVALDMPSALHPQTLLCYEMNGKPLSLDHGAPLRLAIPVKYGIKNIKRIGTITYTDERPRDFWAEQGYDYYAGL